MNDAAPGIPSPPILPSGSSATATATAAITSVSVAVVAIAPALGAVAFWIADRPPWNLDTWYMAVDVMVAVVYGTVAAVLLRHTWHPAAWVLAVAAIGGGWAAFGAMYLGHSVQGDPLPAWQTVGSAAGWAWVPGTLALVVVLPWLVRREPLGPGARTMAAAGVATCVVVWAVRITNPAPWPDGESFMPLAIQHPWWARTSDDLLPWLFVLVVALGLVAAADVTRRQAAPDDPDRRSLRWLAIGAWVMALSFVPLTMPSSWFDGSVAVNASTPVLHLAAQAFLPAATLVAVLRQRLWGVDLVVSRALPWGVLTGALAIVYALVAAAIGATVGDRGTSSALAAAAVGALVVPGHRWLQRRVDLLVYGDVADALGSMRRMGQLIGTAHPEAGTLLDGVLGTLTRSLRVAGAAVTAAPGDARVLAAVGRTGGAGETVALEHRGRTIGELHVTPHLGERLDARTRRSLVDLAPIVAAVVTLVRLNDELVQAQQRLTTARLEERRLVRRDLHDGLGPALAGIGLGLRASQNLLVTDPPRAGRLLDELAAELESRVSDVRELSRALLPPVLDELGLLAAVHDLAARLRHDGVDVAVATDELVDLSGDVATAAFAVVSESTMNARRHAMARRVRISLSRSRDGRELQLVVEDDGAGWSVVPDESIGGVGLRSMRERAAQLGGGVTFDTGELGGARVTWHAPCDAEVAS